VRRVSFVAAALWLSALSAAAGQDWAREMFDHTSHDFGIVAKGSKSEHRFTFENKYLEDIHIASVQSTCTCTIPELTRDTLKTYETAEIIARLDTRKFEGRREATIKVKIDQPFEAEVQLHVYSYIRRDVVLTPSAAQFGSVSAGVPQRMKVTVSYAGRGDWQVLDVESRRPYLSGKVVEVGRAAGQVTYDLWVEISKDAPAGYLNDHLMLVTNDLNPRATRVPVPIEGVIVPPLAVNPSRLSFGYVRAGQTVSQNLVIRAKTPFRIKKVSVPDGRFSYSAADAVRPVHLVPITFTAEDDARPVSGTVHIETDLGSGESLDVAVDAKIVAADGAAPSNGESPTAKATASPPVGKSGPLLDDPNSALRPENRSGWKPIGE
jgi:hypothetical protein